MILIPIVSVAGNWSDWTNTTACSEPCGGGTWDIERKCDNPPPALVGGQECKLSGGSYGLSEANTSVACHTFNCPGN